MAVTPKAQAGKKKIKWISLPISLCPEGHYQENEKTITKWEKTVANHVFNEGLLSRIYKKLLQLHNTYTI